MNAASRTPRTLRAVCATALACVALLALGVAGAGATSTHPTATNRFGPDGTAASEFPSRIYGLSVNQADQHLFAYAQGHLHGFALASTTARTPLGPPFPIEIGASETFPSILAENPDYLYYFAGRNIYGLKENGEKIADRFPVSPPISEGYACGDAIDGEGNLWTEINEAVWYEPTLFVEFRPEGGERREFRLPEEVGRTICAIGFDKTTNDMYVSGGVYGEGPTYKVSAASNYERASLFSPISAKLLDVDSATGIVFMTIVDFAHSDNYIDAVSPQGVVLESFAHGNEEITGLAIDESDDTVYVGRNGHVEVFPAGPIIADAITGGTSSATGNSATVTASVDPAGGPPITGCKFEYGETTKYELGSVPCDQTGSITSAQQVTATLPNLESGRRYHYRIVVENSNGPTQGADRFTQVAATPTVDSLLSTNVTSSSAEIVARISPQGSPTTYYFEYGTTAQYGSVIPATPAAIGSAQEDIRVGQQLTGLQPTTYHFRVVAENQFGRTISADQTINFYPPECPNAHQRQQTGGSNLPDCRAYELVSPGDAGGAIMFPETAPATPYASNPARFAFGAALGVIPGSEATNAVGVDTFVSTRTDTGWVTNLGGLRGRETLGASLLWGDKSFDKVLDFREPEDFGGTPQPHDFMPYIWNSKNEFLERWPANLEAIANSSESRGAYQPSGDFSHFAFSSNTVAWTKGGLEGAPGSAYDYDVANHTTTLISVLPNGAPIPQSPNGKGNEFIFFPGNLIQKVGPEPLEPFRGTPALGEMSGVSEDGSHILMATTANGFSGNGEEPETKNVILYERVDDAITYMVSEGKPVNYVGMTEDGSRVYFTSTEQLTPEDTDQSLDLYVWNEATDSIKLLSASSTAGNNSKCEYSEWAESCEIEVVQGEDKTDNSLAADNGDIYFYSPELLAGKGHGAPGKRNLYVARDGAIQYVATFEDARRLAVTRIQVSPDGAHMALLTKSQLNSYENAGLAEMYTWEPRTERLICVSCLPDGEEPTSNVEASLDGLFMSNDGRAFFYTADPLVARDTDKIHDVYEYTEGQAQLISSGVGSQDRTKKSNSRPGGLSGVSANGVDAYFVTYDNLIPQDLNGQFLKFYDARVDGGFSYTEPEVQCEAADECHGEGNPGPTLAQIVSEDSLGSGGNVQPAKKAKAAKKKHKKKHHKKHAKSKGNARKQAAKHHVNKGGKG